MATRNIVPRNDGEGGVGTSAKHWGSAYIDNHLDIEQLNLDAETTLTISSGAITVTQAFHSVDTEASAASDDLDTINGGTEGDILFIIPESPVRNVTLKHNTGNIVTSDGSDLVLDTGDYVVLLVFDGTYWRVMSGSGGGGSTELTFLSDNFSLDGTDIGSDKGSVWGVFQTVDYDPDTEGAAWISFKLPDHWDASSNIKLDLYYNLDGSNDSTNVDIECDSWCVSSGDTPTSATPTESDQYTLSTGVSQNDALRILTNATSSFQITAANITAGDLISIRIRRDADDGVNDTYTGTFQLIKLRAYQE